MRLPALLLLTLTLSRSAQAQDPSPLCAALMAERTQVAVAVGLLEAGADPNGYCPTSVTVRGRRLDFFEVVLGVLIPPIGAVMLYDASTHRSQRMVYPAPLDLAIGLRSEALVDALLAAGADPLQPAQGGLPRPLSVAVGQDVARGGTTWTDRLSASLDHVPADFMAREVGGLDGLLDRSDLLQRLLALGLDPEGRDDNGGTWLLRAVEAGNAARLEAALRVGADPNLASPRGTPLAMAVREGELELVGTLVQAGADPRRAVQGGPGLLTLAVQGGDLTMVKAVLSMGVPVDGSDGSGPSPLSAAVERGDAALVQMLLGLGGKPTGREVYEAVERGNGPVLELLLAAGAPPDQEEDFGRRPLHAALRSGHTALIPPLLRAGADPGRADRTIFDEPRPIQLVIDANDLPMLAQMLPYTDAAALDLVLTRAVDEGHFEAAEALISHGVSANRALLWRCRPESEPTRRWLRDHGARFPEDSLARVVRDGDLALVRQAVEDGASLQAPGGWLDETPAQAAVMRGDAPIADFLAQAGARLPADWSAEELIRDEDLPRIQMAQALGATFDAGDVREAAWRGHRDIIDLLATIVDDPEAWKGYGHLTPDLASRVEEVHAEKLAKRKAARREARQARRR